MKESYTDKYEKHIVCSYCYKLACIDDKFSRPFKKYLAEDAIYNVISSMTEESKYCNDIMKKHFSKELVIIKDGHEAFKNSAKCWIWNNYYVDNGVKVRDHCYITGKYRGSTYRDVMSMSNQITKFLSYFTN